MTPTPQSNDSEESSNILNDKSFPTAPQRHGCVTAWLMLMLLLNSLTAIAYLFIPRLTHNMSYNAVNALAIIGIVNVICVILLLRWKKIGFYGFAITSIITIIINLNIGISPIRASLGLAGFLVLYGILQIKQDGISAWSYLK